MQTINSHPSLADLAYASIRAEIVSGRLRGGTRLVEAQLARDLGTSRGPVREALRRLSDDGLANVLPRRGVVVRELTANEIRAISEFRIAIETMAARLCVRRRIPTIGLHGLVAELAAAATDGDEERVIELDFAFHRPAPLSRAGKGDSKVMSDQLRRRAAPPGPALRAHLRELVAAAVNPASRHASVRARTGASSASKPRPWDANTSRARTRTGARGSWRPQ